MYVVFPSKHSKRGGSECFIYRFEKIMVSRILWAWGALKRSALPASGEGANGVRKEKGCHQHRVWYIFFLRQDLSQFPDSPCYPGYFFPTFSLSRAEAFSGRCFFKGTARALFPCANSRCQPIVKSCPRAHSKICNGERLGSW